MTWRIEGSDPGQGSPVEPWRQAGSGIARTSHERGCQLPGPVRDQRIRTTVQALQQPCRVGEPSGEARSSAALSVLVVTIARGRAPAVAVQRPRGCVRSLATASQVAVDRRSGPSGRWLTAATPYLRSRIAFSISAWRRWSASELHASPRSAIGDARRGSMYLARRARAVTRWCARLDAAASMST